MIGSSSSFRGADGAKRVPWEGMHACEAEYAPIESESRDQVDDFRLLSITPRVLSDDGMTSVGAPE